MESNQDEILQGYFDDLLIVDDSPVRPEITKTSVAEEARPAVNPALQVQSRVNPVAARPVAEAVVPSQSPLVAKLLQKAEELRHLDSEPVTQVESKISQAVDTPVVEKVSVEKAVVEKVIVAAPVVEEPTFVEPELVEEVTQDLVQSEEASLEQEFLSYLQWNDNGLPQWGQERFECLLFKVSGLTLAVPLVALGNIHPLNEEITPLFGQSDWFMGLLQTPLGKVSCVNTAKLVMPERYDPKFEDSASYVISIHGLPWGLAVDEVSQPITLTPDQVKWRGARTQRQWLAGTVVEHMCALLDIYALGKLLLDADKKRKK